MTISLQGNPIADPPRADELRSEALKVVEILHEVIKSWPREFEYALTDTFSEFPMLFGQCMRDRSGCQRICVN
jgi:hypothetical protein